MQGSAKPPPKGLRALSAPSRNAPTGPANAVDRSRRHMYPGDVRDLGGISCGLVTVALVAGCGRLGFDASDAGPTPDGVPPAAEQMPCATAVTIIPDAEEADELHWLQDPAGEWLAIVFHRSSNDHVVRRYRAIDDATGPSFTDAGIAYQGMDLSGSSLVTVGDTSLLAVTEWSSSTGLVLELGAGLTFTAVHPLSSLVLSTPPLARAATGALAVVGVDAGAVLGFSLDAHGVSNAPARTIVPAAASASATGLVATGDGFALTWVNGAGGTCQIAMLGPDLSLRVGPVAFQPTPAGNCDVPRAAWLPASQRLVVVATAANAVNVGVYDAALVPVMAPRIVADGAASGRVLPDGDGAWIAFDDISAGSHDLRYARLDAQSTLDVFPTLSRMYDPIAWPPNFELRRVGRAPVLMWNDNGPPRSIAASRLCP